MTQQQMKSKLTSALSVWDDLIGSPNNMAEGSKARIVSALLMSAAVHDLASAVRGSDGAPLDDIIRAARELWPGIDIRFEDRTLVRVKLQDSEVWHTADHGRSWSDSLSAALRLLEGRSE